MSVEARAGGWRTAEIVAAAAGTFLLWRGLFGRRRGRTFRLAAGAFIVRRALGARRGQRERPAARTLRTGGRDVEVVEVKSPAELQPGVASASPRPTFPDRVDRGPGDPSR
jgi:hypothetical protein